MSYQQPIELPSIQTSVDRSSEDIHLRISLSINPRELSPQTLVARKDSTEAPTQEQLGELASRIYKARRTRAKTLDPDFFGEPAWDMLLAAYCLPKRGGHLSVTDLVRAADVPHTTGHRWQTILVERELIDQFPDQNDGRRWFVKLSNKGRELLESYLTRLFLCDNPLAL